MPNNVAELADRSDVKIIAFHDGATECVQAMTRHNEAVAAAYGRTSDEYLNQIESFNRVIHSIVNLAFGRASYVTRDNASNPADLSLFVNEGGYCFGVIWFRDRNHEGAPVQPGKWEVHS